MAAFVYHDGGDVPLWVPRDVTRVVVHPSVRILPPEVFRGCVDLEEVRLPEGLREIGDRAFRDCRSLRRLRCPSTVVRIGHSAFVGCERLSEVELAGIVKVERGAFVRGDPGSHPSLIESIGIPSRAFVVRRGTDRKYACRLVTDGTTEVVLIAPIGASVHHTRTSDEFVLIAPGCLTALPESGPTEPGSWIRQAVRRAFARIPPGHTTTPPNLTELGNLIGAIMNDGEGRIENRLDRVRRVVRKEVRVEVSAILGLAFWKARIDEAERAHIRAGHDRRENAGGRGADGGAVLTREAREQCRGAGKGKVIAQNVLLFLDGLWGNGSQGGP